MTGGRAAFERGVASYRFDAPALPAEVARVAGDSLARTGLFLLGERHGMEQTPAWLDALVRSLGIRALAFEWSHDELGHVVASGRVDRDALFALPPSAEAFRGDGRFTAGHVALLDRLRLPGDAVLCLDRLDAEGAAREEGMLERLLSLRDPSLPTLVVLGAGHVVRLAEGDFEPLGLLLELELPGVANGALVPSGGAVRYHGERPVWVDVPEVDVVVPVGAARPAVVPVAEG